MGALGLSDKDIPLLWAADFIPVDGAKAAMVIGEFNCSCLGLAGFLDARGKDLKELTEDQMKMGQEMADKIGALAREQLDAKWLIFRTARSELSLRGRRSPKTSASCLKAD